MNGFLKVALVAALFTNLPMVADAMTDAQGAALAISALENPAHLHKLSQAAQKGDPIAEAWYGEYFHIQKNYTKAMHWFHQSASQGNPVGEYDLGDAYFTGHGAPQNYVRALFWLRKAADQGGMGAEYLLGNAYAKGDGVKQSNEQAMYWWNKAAKEGSAHAECRIGHAYALGDGEPQNYGQAYYWYHKANKNGNPVAEYYLGTLYYSGHGVPRDGAKAIRLWHEAADLDYAPAENQLGNLYRHGYGVPQNYVQAFYWYHKAAEQGYAQAEYNVGHAYYTLGEAVPHGSNNHKANSWWLKAAEQGDPEAAFSLGFDYERGHLWGEPKSYAKANYWFLKAVDLSKNNPSDLHSYWYGMTLSGLASDYRKGGYGIMQSYPMEIYWLRKSVNSGDVDSSFSAYYLGNIYAKGQGVRQNYIKAVYWWEKSIAIDTLNPNPYPEYELGKAYYLGHGVTKNNSKAVYWLKKAASQGVPHSNSLLRLIETGNSKSADSANMPTNDVASNSGQDSGRFTTSCDNMACVRRYNDGAVIHFTACMNPADMAPMINAPVHDGQGECSGTDSEGNFYGMK